MTAMFTGAPLPLDKRQRAMLREIGVRVWSPLAALSPAGSAPVLAIEPAASPATKTRGTAVLDADMPAPTAPTPAAASRDAFTTVHWQLDTAHALFANAPPEPGPRWLVLAEAPGEPATANPLDGEAGQLLANMLRAARLAHPGRVVLVPLRRCSPATIDMAAPSALATPLAALIATHQPDLLLVMGRLAAQALLHTPEPLGKLRGRVHDLLGVRTVVTYDAQPLLRTPADKAKAWDDLCLGIVTAATAATASTVATTAPAPAAEPYG